MAFPLHRMPGVQPDVEDGLRGEGLVLSSAAGFDPRSTARFEAGSWWKWLGGIDLLVHVPGRDPFLLSPQRWMTRQKYPVAGTTLPVTVDRNDPTILRIEWDEVPTIDEWIAQGHPVFTDPESVHASLTVAMRAYQGSMEADLDQHIADAMGPGAALDREGTLEMLGRLRASVHPEQGRQANRLPPIPPDRPGATILAVSPGDSAASYHGEMLLSVAVPGRPRYGLRWRGAIGGLHLSEVWQGGLRLLDEWSEIAVSVDPGKPENVDIDWEWIPNAFEVAARQLHREGDRLQAEVSGGPVWKTSMDQLLAAIPDPERRAAIQQQMNEAMTRFGPGAPGASPAAPPAAVDPIQELERLGRLRDAGELTEEQFAAAKARVLDEM